MSPSVVSKIYLGGGGGAGGVNNGTADTITTFPPTGLPSNGSTTAANGATGSVTSSGAAGGGIVILRAGSVTVSAASTINAYGLRAYNKSTTTNTDAAGGGGAGGTVVIDAGTAAVSNLTVNVNGGSGGSSNYFNHGPGGGGGGGVLVASMSGITSVLTGGSSGSDACCGGMAGNGSPKAWGATRGSDGVATVGTISPPGSPAGGACLPNLAVVKSTSTPLITSATGATAVYTISAVNTGGAATNVYLFDASLPPGWTYATSPAPTYTYAPLPPMASNFAAGAETTAAGGFTSPPTLPASTGASANTASVSILAAGAAPGAVPSAGNGSLTFGSFFIPQNGQVSVSFVVSIPDTATVGTYHNPAGAVYLDPTRTAAAARMVTMATNANANRATLAYSANTTFASGGVTTVPGSNYSGLVAGPASEDVTLLPDFSVTKTASASATPGATLSYTITPRNNGRAVGSQTFSVSQATDVASANIGSSLGSNPLTVTDTLPAGVTMSSGALTGTNWTCSGTSPVVCTLPNANAWPIAAATNFASISGNATMTIACSTSPTPRTNTVQVSAGVGETLTANNTATAATTPTCASANLSVTKTNAVTSLVAGATTSYTVTFANAGPAAANNAQVSDTPSAGLSCTSVTCAALTGGASCPSGMTLGVPLAGGPAGFFSTGTAIANFPASSGVLLTVQCGVTATGQ